jgi:hypothetical protein
MTDIEYVRTSASPSPDSIADLVELYAAVYSEPPYDEGPEQVERFAKIFPEETIRPGFGLIEARLDGLLIGSSYGWTMESGEWFASASGEPPQEIKDAPKLAVMEWIVHPTHLRRGIGRCLMVQLLANRPEPWAVLASDPRSEAREIYGRAGWLLVGTSKLSWGPEMDLLALPLRTTKTNSVSPLAE